MKNYQHLGPFSDLVEFVGERHQLFPTARPGLETQEKVKDALAFSQSAEFPQDVNIEKHWERDGVIGEEITWSVGYGPRSAAWLLHPAGQGPWPGVIALHDHGGFKYYGKEKIADGPDGAIEMLAQFRSQYYAGRAFANELAREGFAVLVPDAFLWGSRKIPLENMSSSERDMGMLVCNNSLQSYPEEIFKYNISSGYNEHTIAKYCNIIGTTLAGIISYEDRCAVEYLIGRKDICTGHIGCIGLSGGGLRSTLLNATCKNIKAAVVVGLMSTYQGLLDHNVFSHTWMLFPHGWGIHGDWPDLAACRAPSPMLVQYDLDDGLFTVEGMKDADKKLASLYRMVDAEKNYCGEFYQGPHKFDLEMQTSAFAWLRKRLCNAERNHIEK